MNYKDSAEKLAKSVLKSIKEKYGDICFPIDPFKLLKDSNIIVTSSDFEKLEGIIMCDEDDVTIVSINRNRPLTRQRFTAAHEYCHFLNDIKKDKKGINRIECIAGSDSEIEKYADHFASCLLMPRGELLKICNKYKNKYGYVDFENIVYISEYFGVSFESCVFSIAYSLHMIDGDIESTNLRKRIRQFHPDKKRLELLETTQDHVLLGNLVDSCSFVALDLRKITGVKFINKYIYNDNRLEGILQDDVNYILADLLFNKGDSEFISTGDENIIMTLGNYELQKYVLTTEDKINVTKCGEWHSKLYAYAPYPEYSGIYRTTDAQIQRGTVQPIAYVSILSALEQLQEIIDDLIVNKDNMSLSQYIYEVVKCIYTFIIIHPFMDGNGRLSRALLNWLLRLKNIPPIYIDSSCKKEYLGALSAIDKRSDFVPLVLLIEKRIINTLVELQDYLFIEELIDE